MEIPLPPAGEREAAATLVVALHRDDIAAHMDRLVPLWADLNTEAFALNEPTTHEEAAHKLATADLLLLAEHGGEPVGFGMYQLIPSSAGRVIYQARGLLAGTQGLGHGRSLPVRASVELNADFLIAKAQNPISIWSTMSSGLFERVQPIDGDFTESPEMSQVLADTLTARGKVGEADPRTGLHRGSYPMGKLGDYQPVPGHPGIARVQARLAEIGVSIANGDAIYYGGKIKK